MKHDVGEKTRNFVVLKVNEGVRTETLTLLSPRAENQSGLCFALSIYRLRSVLCMRLRFLRLWVCAVVENVLVAFTVRKQ